MSSPITQAGVTNIKWPWLGFSWLRGACRWHRITASLRPKNTVMWFIVWLSGKTSSFPPEAVAAKTRIKHFYSENNCTALKTTPTWSSAAFPAIKRIRRWGCCLWLRCWSASVGHRHMCGLTGTVSWIFTSFGQQKILLIWCLRDLKKKKKQALVKECLCCCFLSPVFGDHGEPVSENIEPYIFMLLL